MQNIELQIKNFKPLADNETIIAAMGVEFGCSKRYCYQPREVCGSACIVATGIPPVKYTLFIKSVANNFALTYNGEVKVL